MPLRRTVSETGCPPLVEISARTWSKPVMGWPSMATMRSCARSPAFWAGRPFSSPATTAVGWSGCGRPVMASPVRSRNANRMFANGPAPITISRFDRELRQ